MTMEKTNKKIKDELFSTNTETVISAIGKVSQKGNRHYLPILFDLLNSKPEKEIEDEITKLLATVKDKESIPNFIKAIEDKKYQPILKSILTTCWQNGLDFSNHLPLFVDLVINENWEISFEAFTIIDNFEFMPEQQIIDKTSINISAAIKTASEQKAYFLQEILTKIS